MKKILIVSFTFLSLLLLIGCNKSIDENKSVYIKKGKIDNKNENGLVFSNSYLSIENGRTTYKTLIKNESDKDINIDYFYVIFKNSKDEEIINLPCYVGGVIKKGDSQTVDSNIDIDLSKAVKVEYRINSN